MNALGMKMENWRNDPQLNHYCADHTLQKTALIAYSGNTCSTDKVLFEKPVT